MGWGWLALGWMGLGWMGLDWIALALLDFCRDKLASFKVPAEIRIVTDFPRVTLGKIDKKTLRKSLAEEPPL